MSQNFECRVSVNILLEAADRLFAHSKVPFALTLIHVVLEQFPDHARARKMYETFTGASAPDQSTSKMHRLYHDPETGSFFAIDKDSNSRIYFKTLEEADQYLRKLK